MPFVQGSEKMATTQPEGAHLDRTPEIRETSSGNVEVRKDADHVNKMSKPEEVLGSKGTAKTASKPEDILAFQRTVGDTDTPLE